MIPVQAKAVFTPGKFPAYTYVERAAANLEASLQSSLETTGEIVSLSGPSKSGKTVLVEKVVGQAKLVSLTGATIEAASDVWDQVLDQLQIPDSTSDTSTASAGAAFKGVTLNRQIATQATRSRRGLRQAVQEMGARQAVLLLDDFHYIERQVQDEIAKGLKEAARLGMKTVIASVPHRGDDVVRALPELRGRVRAIDLAYWNAADLQAIATSGFGVLNLNVDPQTIEKFVTESAGSPQLMQSLCLEVCEASGLREACDGLIPRVLSFDPNRRAIILVRTSAKADFRSLFDVLDAGPPMRGTRRNVFKFKDGTEGDAYRVVLKAIAMDPPRLSFGYDELLNRTNIMCEGEGPGGSSVTSSCVHMARLAAEKFPRDQAIEWDESRPQLDLPDPYFMFYLRWSGRLNVAQKIRNEQVDSGSADSSQEPA